jgi:hypothetical protein
MSRADDLSRLHPRLARLRPVLPWVSLIVGVVSAAAMDRRPERAGLVTGALALSWLGLLAFTTVGRVTKKGGRGLLILRLGSRLLALAPTQLTLFFTVPFYLRAATGSPAQLGFVAGLVLLAALTLWDPLHEWVATHPLAGAALQAVTTFVGLNVLFPLLGAGNTRSLVAAAGLSMIMAPLVVIFASAKGARRRVIIPALLAALAPLVLLWPPARAVIPPAPLRLIGGGIGTHIDGMELAGASRHIDPAPSELACLSVVWAPRDLRDTLVHVWRKDGNVVDTIPLTLRGGRESGFRTWSSKQNLGANPHGEWRCRVQTVAGQLLGEHAVRLGPR